ncbi:MAG TPA: 30S ribosomal protein S16 [Actinomycetota bacterium]|nr:30S ribosomal protein S16 [Actinomycetota bacterium]
MVKIRLMRVGKRKQPSYRVVVADARSPRDGRIIEAIGHYQPREDPSVVVIDNDRALHWLQRGAQPSDQVRHLLRISGAWTAFTGEVAAAPSPRKATPAGGVKATPAASISEDTTPGEAEPAIEDANADEAEQEMPSTETLEDPSSTPAEPTPVEPTPAGSEDSAES